MGRFEQPNQNVIINREVTTPLKYKSKEGELIEDSNGKFGDIDLQIILNGTYKIYLELEYPRGMGREQVNFKNHIQRDLIKLNAVKDSVLKAVLIFDYKDYDGFDHQDEIKMTAANQRNTWIFHVRLPYKEKKLVIGKNE